VIAALWHWIMFMYIGTNNKELAIRLI